MRKVLALLLGAAFCLAGCAQPVPEEAADGAAWNGDWVTVGNIVGVDTPDGMEPQENNDALAQKGMYYATWSIGEGESYVNADGDDAVLYEGQVYLLLAGYNAAEKAEDAVAEWLEMAFGQYEVESALTDEHRNGQAYSIITYTCASETNPYAMGASAFGVYRNYAVSVELLCQEDSGIDPRAVLDSFLEACHYAK